jgi:hypothetical protein
LNSDATVTAQKEPGFSRTLIGVSDPSVTFDADEEADLVDEPEPVRLRAERDRAAVDSCP